MNEPANRNARRKKLQIRRQPVLQAIHHLGNFLTMTTVMSTRACSLAPTPEDAAAARKAFFQLFGEISATMAALDEVANPSHTSELQGVLDKLRDSSEYKQMMAMGEAERIAACYVFTDGVQTLSVMHPEEQCFEVSLRAPCRDFGAWLISRECTINGDRYAVIGVEYKPLEPPFKAGDRVKLVVRPVAEDGTISDKPLGGPDAGPEAHSASAAQSLDSGSAPLRIAADPHGGRKGMLESKIIRGPQRG